MPLVADDPIVGVLRQPDGSAADPRQRLRELAQTRVRLGYRRLRVLLQREGWTVGEERFYRVYTEERLAIDASGPGGT